MEKKLDYQKVLENIQRELKTYVQKSGLKSLVLGISGGIDSALVAAIARPVCDELNIPLIGRSINITSSNKQEERDRAIAVGKAFCTDFKEVDLTDVFEVFSAKIIEYEGTIEDDDHKELIRLGNIKCRQRMIFLYNLAQQYSGMVLATDNLSESATMGCSFFSLHGDVGDWNGIQNLWKTECYDLARYLCCTIYYENHAHILRACIGAKASDGLGISENGDLGQLQASSYGEVDKTLQRYHKIKNKGKEDSELLSLLENPIIQRHLKGLFKANNPYNLSREAILKDA